MHTDAQTVQYLSEAVAGLIGLVLGIAVMLPFVIRHPVQTETPRTKRGKDGRFVR